MALRLETGDTDGAAADVAAALQHRAEDPRLHCLHCLHCLHGLVALEQGDPGTARAALDRALALDPARTDALANRAVLRFDSGDVDGAVADLTAALELTDDPAVRENRAVAHEAAGRLPEAIADCELALAHPDAAQESARALLDRCRGRLLSAAC